MREEGDGRKKKRTEEEERRNSILKIHFPSKRIRDEHSDQMCKELGRKELGELDMPG